MNIPLPPRATYLAHWAVVIDLRPTNPLLCNLTAQKLTAGWRSTSGGNSDEPPTLGHPSTYSRWVSATRAIK